MNEFGSFLSQGSLAVVLFGLALTQLGLPLPETPFIVAAGVLSQRGGLALVIPIVACSIAVLVGDVVLYYLASSLGPAAFRHRPLKWLFVPKANHRIDALFDKHGSATIFFARFISGVRAVVFILAGVRGVPIWRFVLWDGLAIAVTVPVFAALGYSFATCLVRLDGHIGEANRVLLVVGVVAAVGYVVGTVFVSRWKRQA